MSLKPAHEGYEYQDLLTSYFILKEILEENNSTFKIDVKEFQKDKIDDLTIINTNGIFKKQIKYSNAEFDHTLEKGDISAEGTYKLALDTIYQSWLLHPDRKKTEIRLCLSWNEPTDKLIEVLEEIDISHSFPNYKTTIYRINPNKLWPSTSNPINSWRRFKRESKTIDRTKFVEFCEHLFIEVNFPKFGLNIYQPDDLEKIVLEQITKLGIGIYPNEKKTIEEFALGLMHLVKRCRSKGIIISVNDLFTQFQIVTNFGSIKQIFPIDQNINIQLEETISSILSKFESENKILLIGEPGSGKSWFIENLIKSDQTKKYNIARHYCYTDLQDSFAKQRITLNVFFGNLINDILQLYPNLKQKKEKLYASNLHELNLLLQNVETPTLLIIDGLDHIDRIFEYRKIPDLSLQDIDIINNLNKLNISKNIKILLLSQPIKELDDVENYHKYPIPKWGINEVKSLLTNFKIEDTNIDDKQILSDYLLTKSNGNPLYLTYLIKEIKSIKEINLTNLSNLPAYSYNLSNYYNYLLSKLNTRESVPRILSGVNFNLTRRELIEITHEGDFVNESLEMLSPILRVNVSQSGYIIYHESFRRFIASNLEDKNLSIDKLINIPIISWFETQEYFKHPKSYYFFLQFLFECQRFDKILDYVDYTYIHESIYWGYSINAIEKNYYYFARAATYLHDFSNTILVNEIGKIIGGTENVYNQYFEMYFTALGYIHGFQKVAEFLSYDSKPQFSLQLGLKACYLCDQNNIVPPWSYYINYFKKGEPISKEDFKIHIRYLLSQRVDDKFVEYCKIALERKDEYTAILVKEFVNYPHTDYINTLIDEYPQCAEIFSFSSSNSKYGKKDLEEISNRLVEIDYISDDISLIEEFFEQIKIQIDKNEIIEKIITSLSNINWFYNWVIFYIKLIKLKSNINSKFDEVKKCFSYLIRDVDPFKGKPRTCDLYKLQPYIFDSIKEGLQIINETSEWEIIINILSKLSDETTTSLQGSLGGPLTTEKLFELLSEESNDFNIDLIIKCLEKIKENKSSHHLHEYITEYHFRLSILYSKKNDFKLSTENFRKGIQYLLGYTFRRDISLEELIESIESYAKFDPVKGESYIKEIKLLADSVVDHTDGKDTKHFPIYWFSKYMNININDSCLYLLNELSRVRYNWRLEASLINLLIKLQGSVNPLVEMFIARTFIVESSESFIVYCLSLLEKVKEINYELSYNFSINIFSKFSNVRNEGYTKKTLYRLDKINRELKLKFDVKNLKEKERYHSLQNNFLSELNKSFINRNQISTMSLSELIDYFKENELKESDQIPLFYYFEGISESTEEVNKLIKTIISKSFYLSNKVAISNDLFYKFESCYIYYLICRFSTETGGWYEQFYNINLFQEAYSINPKLAIKYLFEFLDSKLNLSFHRDMSANLINALISVNFEPQTIQKSWINLFETIDNRLPSKEEYNWDLTLKNELDLDLEEIIICILFTRLKSDTTERHRSTFSSISYLIKNNPLKMIKPIKWFLLNSDKFLSCNLLILLDLLFNFETHNTGYLDNFRGELESIYPTEYYMIDFLIEIFLPLPHTLQSKQKIIYLKAEKQMLEMFTFLNYRNTKIAQTNLDFSHIVGKYKNTFKNVVKTYEDLYLNRVHESFVKHINPANFLLELINKDFYNDFRKYNNQNAIYDDIRIDYQLLLAQFNSRILRPEDLIHPVNLITSTVKLENDHSKDWIRLAHYENELIEDHSKFLSHEVYAGIIFSNSISGDFPFLSTLVLPKFIWENPKQSYPLSSQIVIELIQKFDTLENYKILWLNPTIINNLGLVLQDFNIGLSAVNKNGEVILKYNCWSENYAGSDSLDDEIPKLDGAELLIRSDYFRKICDLFDNKEVFYRIFKVGNK